MHPVRGKGHGYGTVLLHELQRGAGQDTRFYPNCGRLVHESAAVSTPKADVSVQLRRRGLYLANNGTEPVTMSDVRLYLYDNKNREYETDGNVFGYVSEEKHIFLLNRVNPSLSLEAQVIYTVPPDAAGFELEVTSGCFQSEVERLSLGFREDRTRLGATCERLP